MNQLPGSLAFHDCLPFLQWSRRIAAVCSASAQILCGTCQLSSFNLATVDPDWIKGSRYSVQGLQSTNLVKGKENMDVHGCHHFVRGKASSEARGAREGDCNPQAVSYHLVRVPTDRSDATREGKGSLLHLCSNELASISQRWPVLEAKV